MLYPAIILSILVIPQAIHVGRLIFSKRFRRRMNQLSLMNPNKMTHGQLAAVGMSITLMMHAGCFFIALIGFEGLREGRLNIEHMLWGFVGEVGASYLWYLPCCGYSTVMWAAPWLPVFCKSMIAETYFWHVGE